MPCAGTARSPRRHSWRGPDAVRWRVARSNLRALARRGRVAYGKPCRFLSLIQDILSGRSIAFQTGRPACMSGRIAARDDGAGEFQAHHGAELEAMAGAGRHDPALGALLLDNEAFVGGHGIEAGFQTGDAPALEAFEQTAAALEQRPDLGGAGLAAAGGIAAAAEGVVADLEAATFGRRHEVEADIARLVDDHWRPLPSRALVVREVEIGDDLPGRNQATPQGGQQPADPGARRHHDDVGVAGGA